MIAIGGTSFLGDKIWALGGRVEERWERRMKGGDEAISQSS
jgi:hypothetical protein